MSSAVIISLFMTFVVLAAIPGPGVLLVVAQTAQHGLRAGLIASAGIVAGDYVYIALAFSGLAALAQHYEAAFNTVRLMGAGYLLWLGVNLLRPVRVGAREQALPVSGRHFWAAWMTTLANPKAVIFYLGLLPAFVDLGQARWTDFLWVVAMATLSVGGVMVLYAHAVAYGLARAQRPGLSQGLRWGAACLLAGSGAYLAWQVLA